MRMTPIDDVAIEIGHNLSGEISPDRLRKTAVLAVQDVCDRLDFLRRTESVKRDGNDEYVVKHQGFELGDVINVQAVNSQRISGSAYWRKRGVEDLPIQWYADPEVHDDGNGFTLCPPTRYDRPEAVNITYSLRIKKDAAEIPTFVYDAASYAITLCGVSMLSHLAMGPRRNWRKDYINELRKHQIQQYSSQDTTVGTYALENEDGWGGWRGWER